MVEDRLGETLRLSLLSKRRIRANLLIGKISFEEITLMLASSLRPVQCAALGVLERLSFDQSPASQPSLDVLMSMLDALCGLFVEGLTEAAATATATATTTTESAARNGSLSWDGGSAPPPPFGVLKRKGEGQVFDISRPLVSVRPSLLESIVNIIRNWAMRPELPAMVAKHPVFIWRVLFPVLSRFQLWQHLNSEVYQGLWLVLLQVAPHISLTDRPRIISVLEVVAVELQHCMGELTSAARLMHPALMLESATAGTEAVKKGIIQFIKVSNQFWRQLPPHCFLLLDCLCRMCSNIGPGGVFDSEEYGLVRGADPLGRALQTVLGALWRVVENFVMVALGVAFLIGKLLCPEQSPSAALERQRYSESVLHNVQFGLPDGGYLELALLCMLHVLRRSSPEVYRDWARKASPSLISWCDSLRRLWINSAALPTGPDGKSPLFTQPFTASSSQPYLVLIRLYAILGHLSYHLGSSLEGPGPREAAMVVEWMAGVEGTAAGRQLLDRVEFLQVAELLLASINIVVN